MNTPDVRITILIVDDHPVVRDGLEAMLSTQDDFLVIGQAANGQEALGKVASLRPEIMLLDLEMPEMDGVSVLEELDKKGHNVQVIVFTAYDTDERILRALQAGARGYLLKGAPHEELFKAIRVIHQGGSLLEPVVASRLLGHIQRTADSDSSPIPALTKRELEVLNLMAKGKANKEIAESLVISERTVKFHVSSIMKKLGVSNRTEAVSNAAQIGIIEL